MSWFNISKSQANNAHEEVFEDDITNKTETAKSIEVANFCKEVGLSESGTKNHLETTEGNDKEKPDISVNLGEIYGNKK